MSQLDWPTLAGVKKAADFIGNWMQPTPLVRSEMLSRAFDADVWLKNETVTPIASFKLRGALNAALQAKQEGCAAVVTSSTGNHGQGVAWAARALGLRAEIFLPRPANPVKAAMIEAFGASLHEVGNTFELCKLAARDFAAERQYLFIDDGEHRHVMEGAGTVGLEIAAQLDGVNVCVIPLGGGNLSAGCCIAIKSLQPDCRVMTVQAKGSPAVTESFHARETLTRDVDTIADGLVTGTPPGLAMAVLWQHLDDAWLADDQSLLCGVHSMAAQAHVLVEPAGAAALTGAWQQRDQMKGKRVVLVLSGANISADMLHHALEGSALW